LGLIYSPSTSSPSSLVPDTGKSPAIEKIISPLRENNEIGKEIVISGSTSFGRVKVLAKHGKAFACSSEIYFLSIKLLKNDETASGDIQLLCKLFSGETATYHFATENRIRLSASLEPPSFRTLPRSYTEWTKGMAF